MALSTNTEIRDVQLDRMGFGTIGNDHAISKSISGRKIAAIIDDSDPRIVQGFASGYGTTFGDFTYFATTDFVAGGTQTIIGGSIGAGTAGSAMRLNFTGTTIAVLGSTNPNSGNMRVYIDGVATAGRVPVYCGIRLPTTFTSPVIAPEDTTIPASGNSGFPAAGELFLNGERITYTSKDSLGFYGCGRGSGGTTAAAHNANETIYLWDSAVGLYSVTDYASKQVLYYNPLLEPGDHSITIIAETNSTSGQARIYFDGFVTGSLLGASNIFTQIATVTLTPTTDANGHCDIGGITARNNDVSRLAFLGMTQTNCETSNTTTMAKLGVKYQPDGTASYYVHNGPASSTFTIVLTFAFIGESL